MNTDPLYRQEHIRLLWVHCQQKTAQVQKITEERKSLKLEYKNKMQRLGNGFGWIKKAFLTMRHVSEMNAFNRMADIRRQKLFKEQQEEIKKLKASWESHYLLSKAG